MSAVNPLPSNTPSGAAAPLDKRVYEPSMEEILASIRRIIADDQSLPGRPALPETTAPIPHEPEPAVERTAEAPAFTPPAPVDAPQAFAPAPQAFAAAPHAFVPAPEPQLTPEPAPEPPAAEAPAPAPEPVDTVASEPPVFAETRHDGPAPTAAEREPTLAHGAIAAPQFAMPDGPVNEDAPHAAAPAAPPTAVEPPTAPEPEPLEEDLSAYEMPIEPPTPEAPEPRASAPEPAPSLFSAATDSSIASAFNMLAASRLADNSEELMSLAREMIRPLLRTWIDDNLPSMVERMVRAEIERVARGGR